MGSSRKVIIFLIFLTGIEPANAGTCVKYESATVSVTGIVSPKQFYGPPNYGEDPVQDEKEIVAVLKLDDPIRACEARGNEIDRETVQTVNQMQMVFHSAPYGRQWNGKRVVVTGTLFPAVTGHHHTPVLIDVVQIQLTGRENP